MEHSQLLTALQSIASSLQKLSIDTGNNFWTVFTSIVGTLGAILAAGASYFSARASSKAARESELARKSEFLPVIAIEHVNTTSPTNMIISIRNVGRDLARSVMISIPTASAVVFSHMITVGNMPKDLPRYVELELTSLDRLLALPEVNRKLRILYIDLFGRHILTQALIVREVEDSSHPRYGHPGLAQWELVLPDEK
jgi:hypothetical protein